MTSRIPIGKSEPSGVHPGSIRLQQDDIETCKVGDQCNKGKVLGGGLAATGEVGRIGEAVDESGLSGMGKDLVAVEIAEGCSEVFPVGPSSASLPIQRDSVEQLFLAMTHVPSNYQEGLQRLEGFSTETYQNLVNTHEQRLISYFHQIGSTINKKDAPNAFKAALEMIDRFGIDHETKISLLSALVSSTKLSRRETIYGLFISLLKKTPQKELVAEVIQHKLLGKDCTPKEASKVLLISCKYGLVDLTKAALAKGANPNHKNSSPINDALHSKEPEIVRILVNHKAKVRVPIRTKTSGQTITPLALARYKESMQPIVRLLEEQDKGYTDEIFFQKELAHRFSCKAKAKISGTPFNLTGFAKELMLDLTSLRVESYYEGLLQDLNDARGSEFRKQLIESGSLSEKATSKLDDQMIADNIRNVILGVKSSLGHKDESVDALMSRLQRGETIPIYSSIRTINKKGVEGGHCYALVLKPETDDSGRTTVRISRCNRGGYSSPNPGILIGKYSMDKTKKILESFKKADENAKGYAFSRDFLRKLNREPVEGVMGVPEEEPVYIPQSKQKTGNCTVSSANSMELALLYFQFVDTIGHDDALKLSQYLLKGRTRVSREDKLREYLDIHTKPSIEVHRPNFLLLEAIQKRRKEAGEKWGELGTKIEDLFIEWAFSRWPEAKDREVEKRKLSKLIGVSPPLLNSVFTIEDIAVQKFGVDIIRAFAKSDTKLLEQILKLSDYKLTDLGDTQLRILLEAINLKPPKHLEFANLLLNAGLDCNKQNKDGKTALMLTDNLEIIKFLLEKGVDPNVHDKDGKTALMLTDNPEIIKLLLEKGADPNVQDKDGKAALMLTDNPEITQLLLEKGADPNVQDKDGKTALMLTDNPEITQLLLGKGADPSISDKIGKNALMYTNDDEVAKVLLEKGVDPNLTDKNGKTALMHAKSPEISELLIDHGADPNIIDKKGRTALFYCFIGGAKEPEDAIELLKYCEDNDVSVDATIKDNNGKTALAYAVQFSQRSDEDEFGLIEELLENEMISQCVWMRDNNGHQPHYYTKDLKIHNLIKGKGQITEPFKEYDTYLERKW